MLTDAQRTAYDRHGFIVVPDVFSAKGYRMGDSVVVSDSFTRNRP
jgi:hypothetical protein